MSFNLKIWEISIISITSFALLLAIVLLTYFVIVPFIKKHLRPKNTGDVKIHQITIKSGDLYCDEEIINIDYFLNILLKYSNSNNVKFLYGNKEVQVINDIFGDNYFNVEIINSLWFFKKNTNTSLSDENKKVKLVNYFKQ